MERPARIERQAMVDELCELVRIDSLSGREGRIAGCLAEKLEAMGLVVRFDNAHKAIGGEVGNIIATLPATREGSPGLMLQSHMDTVTPGEGIRPVIDGNTIRSAGDTILGADAKAGVNVILNAVRHVVQTGIAHGELQVVFCIAEETGLNGAYHLDYDMVSPDLCFVFDGGKAPGTMTTAAPSAYKMTFTMKGKASHAGVRPEAGVNAIVAASRAISRMRLGRIDHETTANIGVIEGGQARNIVPDLCTMLGEARSHDEAKLEEQVSHMKLCLANAALENGAVFPEPQIEASYRRFSLPDDAPVVQVAARAAREAGFEPITETGGGGSDANVFNEHGIPSVICATGAQGAHTLEESLDIDAMVGCAQWLVQIIRSA